MTDPHIRAVELALAKYSLARVPMLKQVHALVDAFLRLIAHRSGLTATMRIGDVQITRIGEAK